ncbi:MAG: hypothetical protein AAF992_19215 [Bacteroidota bacterium]
MIREGAISFERLHLDNRNPDVLIVKKSEGVFLEETVTAVFVIVIFFIARPFEFSGDELIDNLFRVFIILGPAIALYIGLKNLSKGFRVFSQGEIFRFDQVKGEFTLNEKVYAKLSDIKRVETDIVRGSSSNSTASSGLFLYFTEAETLEIDSSSEVDNNDWIGRVIAKFVGCDFEVREYGETSSERIERQAQEDDNLVKSFEQKFHDKSKGDLETIISGNTHTSYAKEAASNILQEKFSRPK